MQTSSKSLTENQQQDLVKRFLILLSDIRRPEEAAAFFNTFLTETEQQVFVKRLAIVWMLSEGKSYEEIRQALHVSSATISSIAQQKDDQGMQLLIKKMKIDDWADKWAEKISQVLPFTKKVGESGS